MLRLSAVGAGMHKGAARTLRRYPGVSSQQASNVHALAPFPPLHLHSARPVKWIVWNLLAGSGVHSDVSVPRCEPASESAVRPADTAAMSIDEMYRQQADYFGRVTFLL